MRYTEELENEVQELHNKRLELEARIKSLENEMRDSESVMTILSKRAKTIEEKDFVHKVFINYIDASASTDLSYAGCFTFDDDKLPMISAYSNPQIAHSVQAIINRTMLIASIRDTLEPDVEIGNSGYILYYNGFDKKWTVEYINYEDRVEEAMFSNNILFTHKENAMIAAEYLKHMDDADVRIGIKNF